ncbi:MAG: hypothetical protein LQ345_005579 [Seirophora villosa]|nr:MAG: hypothetical protein LQ345_005579 [Seirophora villosa]
MPYRYSVAITNLHPRDLAMPADDYTSAAGGGLRLKGVAGSKITKHKKKRPKHPEPEKRSPSANPDAEPHEQVQSGEEQAVSLTKNSNDTTEDEVAKREEFEDRSQARGKTEAELRHEERRRRRLEERLKREGTKTHKERVEEFNHYLSNLSEHHDMPRIGPG